MKEQANKTLLSVRGLCVEVASRSLVEACSFDLQAGEILALIGPNGGGKSTLLRAVAGLQACQGDVTLKGRVAYAPQHYALDRHTPIRVEEFLAARLTRRPIGFGLRRALRAQVVEALKGVEADHLARRPLGALSGGELQRVMLASALAIKPSVLLLDEPASGLDLKGVAKLHQVLRGAVDRQGCAALLISHHLGSLLGTADRVIGLNISVRLDGGAEEVLRAENLAELYGLPASTAQESAERGERSVYVAQSSGEAE